MKNKSAQLRQRLQKGEVLLGTLLSLNAPEVAELFAEVGFDWLFIDGEHGMYDAHALQTMLQGAGRNIDCLIRIPALDEGAIKKALDAGAAGVIVPQVNTAEQAESVVRWGRYPPAGSRGLGIARAQHYGLSLQEYAQTANDCLALVVQAESAEAVRNIEVIAKVSGIDAVLIGPYDLSSSLGRPGELGHPEVCDAIDRITRVCQASGMPLGIFGMTAESVRPYIKQGFQLIVAGIDIVLLGNAAQEIYFQLKA